MAKVAGLTIGKPASRSNRPFANDVCDKTVLMHFQRYFAKGNADELFSARNQLPEDQPSLMPIPEGDPAAFHQDDVQKAIQGKPVRVPHA